MCPPGGTPDEAVVYGKPVVIVRYPDWTKAASLDDTQAFADKLNATLLLEISPDVILNSIEKSKKRCSPTSQNGTISLVGEILRSSFLNLNLIK